MILCTNFVIFNVRSVIGGLLIVICSMIELVPAFNLHDDYYNLHDIVELNNGLLRRSGACCKRHSRCGGGAIYDFELAEFQFRRPHDAVGGEAGHDDGGAIYRVFVRHEHRVW